MDKKTILKAIRVKRIEKGYTQEYMALKLNISQSAYSKLENGQTKLNLSCLVKLSAILNFDFTQYDN